MPKVLEPTNPLGPRTPYKGNNVFIEWIRNKIYKSPSNVIIIVVGMPGSGKSNIGVKLLSLLNPEIFEYMTAEEAIEQRVAFTPQQFLQKLSILKKGDVIVFDEPQINYNARNFFSETNKLINKVITSYRHQQLITIFCTPSMSYVDSQARKVMTLFIEPHTMNQKRGYLLAKVYEQKYNAYMDKIYRKKIRFIDGYDRTLKELNDLKVLRLDPELENAYKKISNKFKIDVRKEVQEKLASELEIQKQGPALTAIEKQVIELKIKERMTKDEIGEHLGLPKASLTKIYKSIKAKGIKMNKKSLKLLV